MNPEQNPIPLIHSQLEVTKQIWSLFQQSYKVEAELIGSDDFPPLRRTVENIQASDSVFVGIIDQETTTDQELIIAAAELSSDKNGNLSIDSFAVSPARFRQGLGVVLMCDIISRNNEREIIVDTSILNHPAIAFYKKAGFEDRSTYTNKHGFDMIRLHYVAASRSDSSHVPA